MVRHGSRLQEIIVQKERYFGGNREDKSRGNILEQKIEMSMVEKWG